jgi:hypothetical protein
LQHGEITRTYKRQGDGFEVQTALALTHHLRAPRREEGKKPQSSPEPYHHRVPQIQRRKKSSDPEEKEKEGSDPEKK